VSWDNLEALLVLSDKYDIPGIASMAADFLKSVTDFSSSSTAPTYIWKWLLVVDRMAAQQPVLEDLIQKVAASFKQTCTQDNVKTLSLPSSVLLTCALAGTWPAPQNGVALAPSHGHGGTLGFGRGGFGQPAFGVSNVMFVPR
jgi:hypothetical protein